MAKFNPKTYDPIVDSTPGAASKYKADSATVVLVVTDGVTCNCGCQEDVKPGRLFRQGHDARLKGKLLRAAATKTKITVVDLADGKPKKAVVTASALARQFGWSGLINTKPKK